MSVLGYLRECPKIKECPQMGQKSSSYRGAKMWNSEPSIAKQNLALPLLEVYFRSVEYFKFYFVGHLILLVNIISSL